MPEPETGIQTMRRGKRLHRTGLEANSCIAPLLRFFEYVLEQPCGDTFAAMSGYRPHGFDFAVPSA